MGLLSGMMGNSTQISTREVKSEIDPLLIPEEEIEHAYKLVRDLVIFTNKRLILVDKQGMTAKKIAYKSISYRSISKFATETAGHFDLDGELKIWISGQVEPSEILQFKAGETLTHVQKTLAEKVL
ncbi:helicase [Weissella viridescens]|uniref:Superfamily I DNA RNA helicase n=1 Tax=Weissella viridescens TaxID=1629 RepID=A0A0R2H7F8_WEIVI|nr:PH domain-containing protein [Weissella viridescens]KRN45975.1 superfamily I DNA RNA helicase [Weissella viridescens]MBX4173319.1 PH domain-containing protein [Weissella viridescens]GEA95112.1 helicase [Weissella viridescens]